MKDTDNWKFFLPVVKTISLKDMILFCFYSKAPVSWISVALEICRWCFNGDILFVETPDETPPWNELTFVDVLQVLCTGARLLTGSCTQNLKHIRNVTCLNHASPETILQGTLVGGRCRGWQRKCWMDKIKEWTSMPMPELLTIVACRKDWKRICWIVPHAPPPNPTLVNQLVKGLNWKQDPCRCAFLRIKTSAWLERLCLNWRHHIRSNYWYLGVLNEIVQCWWIKTYSM